MAKEIERKFLVSSSDYRKLATGALEMEQGYLSTLPKATVRVRICGDHAYITIKGLNNGAERSEWEYNIPVADARHMLRECSVSTIIKKTRYIVPSENGLVWEVDEFHAAHEGLVLAEIEIPTIDYPVNIPSFIGEEVTGDPRYYNSSLASV